MKITRYNDYNMLLTIESKDRINIGGDCDGYSLPMEILVPRKVCEKLYVSLSKYINSEQK